MGMKKLEVRRHSMRKHGGGSQLSQAGVEYARQMGASLGPFARVVTTVAPRTRETAIALGFAVDYELVSLISDEELNQEIHSSRWWESAQPFAALAELLATQGAAYRYAHSMLGLWRDILTPLPERSAALFIGHSGELEMAFVACFPQADHGTWGTPFGPLEGAQLTFGGEPEHFISFELLRG